VVAVSLTKKTVPAGAPWTAAQDAVGRAARVARLEALRPHLVGLAATGATCAVSRRVRSLPQGGQVRKGTCGPTTDLAAKAQGDKSMSSKRGGTEGV